VRLTRPNHTRAHTQRIQDNKTNDLFKKNKNQPITSPAAIIELSGTGPLRTGPWAAHDVAFTPSSTAPLEGVPFEISQGDADLSNVMFSGFENPVFKVSASSIG
jgi:hypothetical protein